MTGRERIVSAINYKEPDKLPIDCGSMKSTGIMAMAYNSLKKHLHITEGSTKNYDAAQQLARMPEGVVYFSQTFWPYYGLEKEDFSDLEHAISKTMWGYFGDPMWKDAGQKDFYDQLSLHAKELHENTEYASMIGFGGNFFEMGQVLYRTDEFLMKLLTSPKEMNMLLDALAEQYLESLDKVINAVSGYVDVIQFGDDFGTQETLMICPEIYRKMIYPRLKKLFSYVHDNSDMKVLLHSCGAIHSIFPDVIDVGVDIIIPVQIGDTGMDPISLKREYGKDIVFWGGGIDTQHILPSGTVQGVPPDNIAAMYNVANSIRY